MSSRPIRCLITVRGRVALHWTPWLGDLRPSYRDAGAGGTLTDLKGILPDQSALQGVLNRIWNLNLAILSISTATISKESTKRTQSPTL
jgi:hypothetical protein